MSAIHPQILPSLIVVLCGITHLGGSKLSQWTVSAGVVCDLEMAYGSINQWRGRGSLARTVYLRTLNDEAHRNDDHHYWYSVRLEMLPEKFCSKFLQCHQDEETSQFLENCYEKADYIFTQIGHSLAKSILSWFMTSTSINGYLGRGSMFVFSGTQLMQLLDIPAGWKGENMIDLGAGDGKVTEKMAHYFTNVYATETSFTMVGRLEQKGYKVLDTNYWDNGTLTYDLISCLNLLDRCDKPVDILQSMRKTVRPVSGRVIVAVVLPFKPYVEQGSVDHKPTQYLNILGKGFEEQVQSFVRDVFEPAGFVLEKFTRLPYLCEGDMENSFYSLDDAVFVLKPNEADKGS